MWSFPEKKEEKKGDPCRIQRASKRVFDFSKTNAFGSVARPTRAHRVRSPDNRTRRIDSRRRPSSHVGPSVRRRRRRSIAIPRRDVDMTLRRRATGADGRRTSSHRRTPRWARDRRRRSHPSCARPDRVVRASVLNRRRRARTVGRTVLRDRTTAYAHVRFKKRFTKRFGLASRRVKRPVCGRTPSARATTEFAARCT